MQAPFFPEQYPEVLADSADALSSTSDLLVLLVPEEAYKKGESTNM